MTEDIRAELMRAYQENPSAMNAVQFARFCLKEGSKEEAKLWLIKAARHDPYHPDLIFQLKTVCAPDELMKLDLPPGVLNTSGDDADSGAVYGRVVFSSFIYPFTRPELIMAMIFGALLIGGSQLIPVVSLGVGLITHSIVFSYVIAIFNAAATGHRNAPIYSGDYLLDMIFDYFRSFLFPFIVCFLIYFASLSFHLDQMIADPPPWLQDMLPLLAGLLGMVCFPIAFLLIRFTNSIWSMFHLPLIVKSISRTAEEYGLCVLVVSVLFAAHYLLGLTLGKVEGITFKYILFVLAYYVFYVYTLFATGRAIGLYYRCCAPKLGWSVA